MFTIDYADGSYIRIEPDRNDSRHWKLLRFLNDHEQDHSYAIRVERGGIARYVPAERLDAFLAYVRGLCEPTPPEELGMAIGQWARQDWSFTGDLLVTAAYHLHAARLAAATLDAMEPPVDIDKLAEELAS